MTARTCLATLTLAGACAAVPAFTASQISPQEPYAFDPVNLRMTMDSCAFAPETVNVSAAGSVIRVAHRLNNCFVAGEVGYATFSHTVGEQSGAKRITRLLF
jgi:hypothetical protein